MTGPSRGTSNSSGNGDSAGRSGGAGRSSSAGLSSSAGTGGPPAGTPVLRRLNTAVVLDAVRQAAPTPVRIAELAALTSLARPTVAQAVEDLLESGWLTQHAPQEDRLPGRPATRFSLNGLAAPVLGIDVGAHSVTVAVADLAGKQLTLVRHTGQAKGAAQLLVTIDAAVAEALSSTGLLPWQVAAVAVGSPGLIDPERGSARIAPSMPGWPEIRIVDHLARTFDCPVLLENDANLAALAISEARETPAPTLLAVQWGERLGSGIVLDGRLHRGALAAAGEIGFITPGGGREPLAAGQRGPLEQQIGAEAIAARARKAAKAHPDSELANRLKHPGEHTDAAHLFGAAQDGDPVAMTIVDDVAGVFASALAPIVLAIAPDAVVIGGGIARAGGVLAQAISAHLGALTLVAPLVELSPLAEDAVVTGAVHLALDEAWQRAAPRQDAISAPPRRLRTSDSR